MHVWRQPRELYNPECFVPTVKGSGSSVMWGAFSWHDLDAVVPLEGMVNANHDLMVLSDHLHPVFQHFFPARRDVFQDDIAPSAEQVWLPNGLMSMTLMLSIHVMAFSVTRYELNRAFMGYCGSTPETAFSTSIKQV